MLELTQTVLNVRFGTIDEDNKPSLDWAKLSIVEDEPTINNGFAGVKVGEIKVSSDDGNKLAKRLHAEINSGDLTFPSLVSLKCDSTFKGKDLSLTVVDYEILNNA